MKYIILLLILLMCFIIIKYTKEKFIDIDGKQLLTEFVYDEDIVRAQLNQLQTTDKAVIDKYNELQQLKEFLIEKKLKDHVENLESVKSNYENTKKKLYSLIYNNYKPNLDNFDEKQLEYIDKLNSIIDPNNTINQVYKPKELSLLSNFGGPGSTNLELQLNQFKNDYYVININGNILYYNNTVTVDDWDHTNKQQFLFQIIKIFDLHHLNQLAPNINSENIIQFNFPFILILKEEDKEKLFVTVKDGNISIRPLTKNDIKYQIFIQN